MKNLLYFSFTILMSIAISGCNKCKDVTCSNGGTCSDGTCQCLSGYSGSNCEIEDLCVTNAVSCDNGGVCVNGDCDCENYYYGESCETYCVNGSYSGGSCICTAGYNNDDCTTIMREAWLGTYGISDECNTNGSFTSIILELENPDDENAVDYVNITNLTTLDDDDAYGYIEDDMLYIPKQSVRTSQANGNQKYTIEALAPASLSGGSYTISLEKKVSSFTQTCEIVMTRQ